MWLPEVLPDATEGMMDVPTPQLVRVGEFAYEAAALPLLNKYRYVYFVSTRKPIVYPKGDSKVFYIGKFNDRDPKKHVPFSSMGWMVDFYIPRRLKSHMGIPVALSLVDPGQGLDPWDCEGAFLNTFRQTYGALPKGNDKGGGPGVIQTATMAGFTQDVVLALLRQLE
jgi:hypothetical protein